MRFSVFSWEHQGYDIFEGPGDANGQRPTPRRQGEGVRGKGAQIESLLPVLPKDAKFVGRAKNPKGRIAIHYSSPAVGLDGFGELGQYKDPRQSPLVSRPWATLGIGILGIMAVYRVLVAIARRF